MGHDCQTSRLDFLFRGLARGSGDEPGLILRALGRGVLLLSG